MAKLFPRRGFLTLRASLSLVLFLISISVGVISVAGNPKREAKDTGPKRLAPPKVSPAASTAPGWSIVSSPNGGTDKWNYLTDVTCLAPSNCWAFGAQRNANNVDQTLAEHWDGMSWSIVSTPNVGTGYNYLLRVTCVSANDCWATGSYLDVNLGVRQTLIEHWDGNSWSIVSSPNAAPVDHYLEGATCTAANNCWAVGFYGSGNLFGSGGSYQTLIIHWDGNTWSIVPSPNAGQINKLGDVTCVSSSDCWAVGGKEATASTPIIEHWDGVSWSVIAAPTASSSTSLSSIHCLSSFQCWAVGMYYSGSITQFGFALSSSQTLIEKWDGNSWSAIASPNLGNWYNSLATVRCLSSSDCWTVGLYENNGAQERTLILHWDGSSWSVISSPNKPSLSALFGLSCPSSSECWAVGQYVNEVSALTAPSQTLVEEYSSTIPPVISAASRMTHGSSGTFDIDLPLTGTRGIESRTSSALGTGNYSVVFSFANNVSSCGNAATPGGTVISGPGPNQCTMNLTGVGDAQTINVELDNVVDAQNNTGNVAVPMGVLIGDASGDGVVNVGDTIVVRGHSGETVSPSNCRYDVNADGFFNVGDTLVVRSRSGDFLP